MRKARYLFTKIRDTKGVFHAKMDTIKDRNGLNLTEGEYIKKNWQEYLEEIYKNILMTQISIMVWSLCESAALNIPVNLENFTVATGLENVSVHSNPKERQCQRMFKLPHNFTHLSC